MVRREDYIEQQVGAVRDRWLNVYSEARQQSAEYWDRERGEGAPINRDEALYANKVGLVGEWACMVYLSPVHWIYYKTQREIRGPDLVLEPYPPGRPPFMDAKTNRTRYRTNYLIVPQRDPRGWIYIHCYIADPVPKDWILVRPTVVIVGWCWGFEAQSKNKNLVSELGTGHHIPHDDEILRPIKQLRVLLDLCRQHGEQDGLERWKGRGGVYEPERYPERQVPAV